MPMINENDLEIAILGSGVEIDLKDFTEKVEILDRATKKRMYFKVSKMLRSNRFKMFEEMPLLYKEMGRLAKELNVHPTVLFYVHGEVLDGGREDY